MRHRLLRDGREPRTRARCAPLTLDRRDGRRATLNVTCLEFSSTPEQNACWTAFDGSSPSINTPELEDLIDNGNPDDFEAGDEAYLDNGDQAQPR